MIHLPPPQKVLGDAKGGAGIRAPDSRQTQGARRSAQSAGLTRDQRPRVAAARRFSPFHHWAGGGMGYADALIPGMVLIEMKQRSEALGQHFPQLL